MQNKVICQEAKECGVPEGVCFHQIAHDERGKEVCGLYMCHRPGFRVQCVYTPEPAKPHGVIFRGTAREICAHLGGLTDERFQAMMHAGITIDTAPNLKADALRVQEDANGKPQPKGYHDVAEYYRDNETVEREEAEEAWEEAIKEVLRDILPQHNPFGISQPNAVNTITAAIVKLPRP